jgi:hypothetical protein
MAASTADDERSATGARWNRRQGDNMKDDKRAQYINRASILELLSDAEVANVSNAETTAELPEGDEYLDLERLDEGVSRARPGTPMGRVLPRQAVAEKTWNKILMQLPAPRFTTGPRLR